MRIRKCASRLLGSAYSSALPDEAPRIELQLPFPPPPTRPYPAAPESRAGDGGFTAATASGETCELSRSPWDLIGELDLSDPQGEDLVEKYFVPVACGASWLLPTCMPAVSVKKEKELAVAAADEDSAQLRHKVAKKPSAKKTVAKKEKESEPEKKAKVKKDEGDGKAVGEAQFWTCKKNDGKSWHCQRPVSRPNSLCKYHFEQKRAYYNPVSESENLSAGAVIAASPAASKPSTSCSKPPRKKSADAGERFYYYTGFGPFRTKRRCSSSSSSSMHESTPAEQEEETTPEDHAAPTIAGQAQADDTHDHEAGARDDKSSCDDIAGIAGSDEGSSDDMHGCNSDGEHGVGVNGDSKRKSQWKKRWRKPVKARSLKSLM